MKERPILFSGAMVRAVLDGTKTQTRRVVKPQPTGFVGGPGVTLRDGSPAPLIPIDEDSGDYGREIHCPHGQPGDRLWVREAWRVIDAADCFAPRELTAAHRLWFEADGPHDPPAGRYRPGMFMPRWASRINLDVTGVRVERLQDISEADAMAEGIFPHVRGGWHWLQHNSSNLDDWNQFGYKTARIAYLALWEAINGPGSAEANPWVWAINFQRVAPC